MTQPHRTAVLPAFRARHAPILMHADCPTPVRAVTVRGDHLDFDLGGEHLICRASDPVTVWFRWAVRARDLTPGTRLPRPEGDPVRVRCVSRVGSEVHWVTDDPAEPSGQAEASTWVEVWPDVPEADEVG